MTTTETTPDRDRWVALYVLCAGGLMIILDASIVTVALPSIQRDLDFSQADLAWVVNAYLVAFGGLLLLAGRLGDLLGRRTMFLSGLTVFTAASAVCGLANSQLMLIAARFVQGIGGAMCSAVILGMIVTLFPDRQEQARAIGVFSFVGAAGASIGLIAGGLLTQLLTWHWIFFVNLPIGLAVGLLATAKIHADRGVGLAQGADLIGAFLVTSGLMLGVYTIVGAAEHGWVSARTLGLSVLAVLLLVGFVVRQATAARPLLPLRLFRSRDLTGANIVQVFAVGGLFGFQFLTALYLERVLGFEPAQIGLAYMPVTIAIAALSLGFSARLSEEFGERRVMLSGLFLILVGLALLGRLPVDGSYWVDLLPAMLILGCGIGVMLPAMTGLAMSGATETDSGVASGLYNTTQQVGAALGLAVLATFASSRAASLQDEGERLVVALTSGYQLSYRIAVGFMAFAIVLAAVILRPRPRPRGAAVAEDSGSSPTRQSES
ncbi:MFS transporter [soil metagenome]